MTIRIQAEAEAELLEADEFYRARSVSAAGRFLDEFERTTGLLEVFPNLGKAVGGGFRSIPLRRYLTASSTEWSGIM